MDTVDVLIVGGGIAGIYSGIELLKKTPSLSILLIEKYNYLGGRVVSFKKDISNVGEVLWENGAGRIHDSNILVHKLLKKYNLKTAPINTNMQFIDLGKNIKESAQFEELCRVYLGPLQDLPREILQNYTLYNLCKELYGIKETQSLFDRFPYYTEVYILRADIALKQFIDEKNPGIMGTRDGFTVCIEGLSELIKRMADDFTRRGGTIIKKCTLLNIYNDKKGLHAIISENNIKKELHASKIICALHSTALKTIPAFDNWVPLKHLIMTPLTRIYMVFPPNSSGEVWFSNIPKTVTTNELRYIIPINAAKGIIMVSYTDGEFTVPYSKDAVYNKPLDGLSKRIITQLRKVFPDVTIPAPLFIKAHPWSEGTTAWTPGAYDAEEMSANSCYGPLKNVYVCGESFSLMQAWMEGAVQQAEKMLKIIKIK